MPSVTGRSRASGWRRRVSLKRRRRISSSQSRNSSWGSWPSPRRAAAIWPIRSGGSNARVRQSMPIARSRSRRSPGRIRLPSSVTGRLSTASNPRSSSAFSAVVRPAPDIPVTRTIWPKARSLDPFGRERQPDLGAGRRRPRVELELRQRDSEDLVGGALRQPWRRPVTAERDDEPERRSTAQWPTRMMPSPRTSISPAMASGGRAISRSPWRSIDDAVVGDQPRAPIDQAQRQIRLATAGRAEQNHAGARELDAAGVQQRARCLANRALGRMAISDRP